jgi:hypothetical protein
VQQVPGLISVSEDEGDSEAAPRGKRHSTGMMVGGIVMVSFVPVALLVSAVASAEQSSCQSSSLDFYYGGTGGGCTDYDATIYGGLVTAVLLAGVGIPMIVV